MSKKQIKTRFAPSPTGFMHIGNVRTALYAYLFAKQNNGKFILRIEDTDQSRKVEGAVEQIQKTLKLAGLQWDEGPYIQSDRLDLYQEKIKELIKKDGAYYCFCTKERLEQVRKAQKAAKQAFKYDGHCRELSSAEVQKKLDAGLIYVVRQKIPKQGSTSYDDVLFGTIEVQNIDLDDSILLKSDGIPTYNFAHVVDDHEMGITHIIRGCEFLSSTPKYVLLYDAFEWEKPIYIHLPTINKNAREKLSKRDGDATFEDLLEKGYLPEAIINYIALLGWHPKDEREIFSLEELIKEFSLDGLSKSPAIFDIQKLSWMNGEYIRSMNIEDFHRAASKYYDHLPGALNSKEISKLLHKRTQKLADIPQNIDFFIALPQYDIMLFNHKKMNSTQESAKIALYLAKKKLESIKEWTQEAIHDALFEIIKEMNVKNGTVLWPVRVALSAKAFTPGGAIEIAFILGKEETIKRISFAIDKF